MSPKYFAYAMFVTIVSTTTNWVRFANSINNDDKSGSSWSSRTSSGGGSYGGGSSGGSHK